MELTVEQQAGIQFLADRPRALLSDDVGFGKTFQLVGASQLVSARRTLFVCGAQAALQTESEIPKVFPNVTVRVAMGNKSQRRSLYANPPQILIVGYETFRNDAEYIAHFKWDALILDDASKFKNWDSQVSRAANLVQSRCRYAWAASATPVEVSLEDLWSIFHAIGVYPMGDYQTFSDTFCEWGRNTNGLGNEPVIIGYKNLELLKHSIAPYILRRTNPDGPEVRTINQMVDLYPRQIELYKAARSGYYGFTVHDRFNRILQFCDTSAFADENPSTWASTKIDTIMHIIPGLGKKVVIYSCWHKTLTHLKYRLARENISYVEISGKVDKLSRFEYQRKFRDDPDCQVCLITKAAESALNLQAAGVMILLNRLTNPARMKQVQGRINRRGTEHSRVDFVNIITRNTLESRVSELLSTRQELFEDVVDDLANKLPVSLMSELLHHDEEHFP